MTYLCPHKLINPIIKKQIFQITYFNIIYFEFISSYCMNSQLEQVKDIHSIILVGDAFTGKTNIIYTFCRDRPPNNIVPTIAVQFSSKVINLDSTHKAKVQIWDTAGQQVYRSLTMSHYRNVNGAFIVFDVSRRSTFDHVAYWLENLREKGDVNIQIGLLGHKTDSSRREVSAQQAEQFANKEHILYAETTINDVHSISSAFKKLIWGIINTKNQGKSSQGNQFRLNSANNQESGCSC